MKILTGTILDHESEGIAQDPEGRVGMMLQRVICTESVT